MRPHYWLPELTSYGVKPQCNNCAYKGDCDVSKDGWICGSYEEAEQYQISMEEMISYECID